MGDVINLNRYRKQKDRTDRAKEAAENRVRHGQTKAEKTQRQTAATQQSRKLEGHRLRLAADTPDAKLPEPGTPSGRVAEPKAPDAATDARVPPRGGRP